MKKWNYVNTKTFCFNTTEHKIFATDNDTYVFFKRGLYTVLKTYENEDGKHYFTEYVRQSGKKHIKFETVFVFKSDLVGICESFFKEA